MKTFLLLQFLLLPYYIFPQFGGGDGSAENPYQVSTPAHLDNVRNYLSAYFIQTADIDLTAATSSGGAYYNGGLGWNPIGFGSTFSGNYNGNGYSITGIMINRTTSGTGKYGLFSYLLNGTIRNVSITGSISGYDETGAICGKVELSSVTGCMSNCTVSGHQYVGGIAGSVVTSYSITNCYSKGSVSGTLETGGLIGIFIASSVMNYCYSTANVSGDNQIGGLIGVQHSSTVSNSYASGDVSGNSQTGGLVGHLYNTSPQSSITNCYFTGTVPSSGINIGKITGTNDQGGSNGVSESYYSSETSGLSGSSGTAKTNAQLKTQATYSGWDFSTTPIWVINSSLNSGYPFLNWQTFYNQLISISSITTTPMVIYNSNIGFTAQSGTVSLNYQEYSTAPSNTPGGSRSIGKYWDITSISGGSIKLKLYYTSASIASFTGLPTIYHYTGGAWVPLATGSQGSENGLYYVETIDYYSSFSPVTVGDANAPLPVELNSFTYWNNGRLIKLNWETETEKNSDKFYVERKTSEGTTWNAVGSVKAAVLSNSPKEYSFTDNNLKPGKYQYRLKMQDNDGSFEYSKVIEAEISVPEEFMLSQNYPNPFNPSTQIEYQLPMDAAVTLSVYSLTGGKIADLVTEDQSAGYYNVNFSSAAAGKNLSTGVYFYRISAVNKITGSNFTSVKKMIMLK